MKAKLLVLCFYGGTLPYNLPVYTTTLLLWLYSFDPNIKITESFYYVEDPVNTTHLLLQPRFYGPTVVTLTGFYCTNSWKYIKFKALKIARRLPWICLCKIDSIMSCKTFLHTIYILSSLYSKSFWKPCTHSHEYKLYSIYAKTTGH